MALRTERTPTMHASSPQGRLASGRALSRDARLRVAFDSAALSLTVGVEEELMLVDRRTDRLLPVADEALDRLGGDHRFQTEFRPSQVELVTRPCLSAADVGRELATARLDLADAVRDRARLLACASHPTARKIGPTTDGKRYRAIAADNPWAARYLLTCGLHVHVAVADADRTLAVYNALRSYLPEFAALAANSPFHRSEDVGAASTRYELNRHLARHGVPPVFPDWEAYAAFVEWGASGGSIPDPTHHWWDLRLHPGYGTLELRACDAQTDLADAVALAGLAQTLVAWLAARYDEGEQLPVHDSHRISESYAIGARTGVCDTLLDLDSGDRERVADRVERLVLRLAPVAIELGTERELARVSLLARRNGAERQRAVVRERGLDGLVDWLATETVASAERYLVRVGVSVGEEDPPA